MSTHGISTHAPAKRTADSVASHLTPGATTEHTPLGVAGCPQSRCASRDLQASAQCAGSLAGCAYSQVKLGSFPNSLGTAVSWLLRRSLWRACGRACARMA